MLSVGPLLDICFGRAFRLTVIGKNLSCSRWRRFGRCDKDYQDHCLVLVLDPLPSTHLIFHEAYFSLVSLVRAEWDGPRTRPRWWRFSKWPSCKYLTVLWCCPCQMSALNNSDYTSHSLHSWRNRSMWHWNTAAALVSFSSIPFEETFFSNADPKIVCWILSKASQQHHWNEMSCAQHL